MTLDVIYLSAVREPGRGSMNKEAAATWKCRRSCLNLWNREVVPQTAWRLGVAEIILSARF